MLRARRRRPRDRGSGSRTISQICASIPYSSPHPPQLPKHSALAYLWSCNQSRKPLQMRPKLPTGMVCCKARRKHTPRSTVAAIKDASSSKMRSRVPLGVDLPHAEEHLQDALQQGVQKNTFVDFERRMRVMLDQKMEEVQNERRAITARNAAPGPISLGAAITAALSKCVPAPAKVHPPAPACGP